MAKETKDGLPRRVSKNGAGYYYFVYPSFLAGASRTIGLGKDIERVVRIAAEMNAAVDAAVEEHKEQRHAAEKLRAKSNFSLDTSGLLELDFIRRNAEQYDRVSGVYLLLSDGEVVYVGKSLDCHARLAVHFREATKTFDSSYIVKTNPCDLDELEAQYIKKFSPKFNRDLPPPRRKTAWGLTQHISVLEVKL